MAQFCKNMEKIGLIGTIKENDHGLHLMLSPPPQFGGQVLEGGDTFPLSSVGFLVAEVTGYFYADITAVEHLSEDCTVGYVPQIDR